MAATQVRHVSMLGETCLQHANRLAKPPERLLPALRFPGQRANAGYTQAGQSGAHMPRHKQSGLLRVHLVLPVAPAQLDDMVRAPYRAAAMSRVRPGLDGWCWHLMCSLAGNYLYHLIVVAETPSCCALTSAG